MILVSACLIGIRCRYDARSKKNKKVIDFLSGKNFYPVCPEMLGGLLIPREKAEIIYFDDFKNVKVAAISGEDVTRQFLNGSKRTLKIAKWLDCKYAIFKEGSPSCGVCKVIKKGVLIDGEGITTHILKENGILVFNENNFFQGGV